MKRIKCSTSKAAPGRQHGRPPGAHHEIADATRASPDSVEVDAGPVSGHLSLDVALARYQGEVYRFATHLTRNRVDADDLYRETVLEARRAFDRLDGTTNHRTWLYTIATNAFLSDRLRREPASSPRR